MLSWLFPERIATTVRLRTETGEILEWSRQPWQSLMHCEMVNIDASTCYVLTENDVGTAVEMARDAIHRFNCLQPTAQAAS